MIQYEGQAVEIIEVVDPNTETVAVRLEDGNIISGVRVQQLLGDEDEIGKEFKRIEYVMLALSLFNEHLRPNDGTEGSDLEKVRKAIIESRL